MDDIEINDHEEAKLLGRGLRKKPPRGVFLTYTQLVLLVVSLVIVYPTLLGLLWISGPVDQICSERTSQWSPLLNDVDTTYGEKRLNGSVYHASKFRGPAGQQTDDAWNQLGVNYSFAVLDQEQASKAGIGQSQLQVAEKYGGGYVVNLEAIHQLHCLDLLRKALHWNYGYYIAEAKGSFNGTEEQVQTHIGHCLDMLREDLMCSSDIGLVGLSWYNLSGKTVSLPKFDTKHQCRNFDVIREWARSNQVIDPPDDYFRQPEAHDIQDGRP